MDTGPDYVPACVLASAIWLIGILAAVLPLPQAPAAKDASGPAVIAATQGRDADLPCLDPVDVIQAHERVDREIGALAESP